MSQSTSNAWIRELVAAVPSLTPLYDEHCADYDEMLPHVFLGDVARYVTQEFADRQGDKPHGDHRGDAVEILRLLEETAARGDPELLELVSVSFLENIEWTEAGGREIRSAMGPKLCEELARREGL